MILNNSRGYRRALCGRYLGGRDLEISREGAFRRPLRLMAGRMDGLVLAVERSASCIPACDTVWSGWSSEEVWLEKRLALVPV